ncbi:MAG: response regulator, partial [Actinobacteria bacterium]|nr:response regulator [Actinomycetota bacterium]
AKHAGVAVPILHYETGEEAISFLRQNRTSNPHSSIGLVLLDLNLPGMSGQDLLDEIRHDQYLKQLPIVILSTSSQPEDVDSCYKLGANAYVVKPVGLAGYLTLVQSVESFWFETVYLPESM